jgi:hypothetical protein
MGFLWQVKGLEASQRLAALVVPKRQALKQHQGLIAQSAEPLLHAELVFPSRSETGICSLFS